MNPPSRATLRKYGITARDWTELYLAQRGRCPICRRMFSDKVRPVVDHLHVIRYKRRSPEEKRMYIRGLLCQYCNYRLLPNAMTRQRAVNIVKYLEKFEKKLISQGQEMPVKPHPKRAIS